MLAHTRKMDVIANNLANVNTHGYKKETASFGAFPELMVRRIYDVRSQLYPSAYVGPAELSADIDQNFVYFNPGPSEWTEKTLDVAIDDYEGEDNASRARSFFTVRLDGAAAAAGAGAAAGDAAGDGTIRYTRDGSFVIGVDQVLRTLSGDIVLGEGGVPITLEGEDFIITKDGTVLQDDAVVGRLLITSFEDPHALRKVGGNYLTTTPAAVTRPFDGVLRQGYVEQSNVNVVSEMVDMIACMRAYEANQKMVWTIDGTLEKAVNEVGRV
jgi:flagellar basal-body rod protein FlgG